LFKIRNFKLGFAEVFLAFLIAFVFLSTLFYFLTGMGNPPQVKLATSVKGRSIVLNVLEGELEPGEWEYLVFNVMTNPPVKWNLGTARLRPGENVLIAVNLSPGTYKVQIRHKLTGRIMLDERVTIR